MKFNVFPTHLTAFRVSPVIINHNAKVRLFPNTYHARSRRGAHFGRMHGRRVQLKEVHTKSHAYGQKLLCVNRGLEENLLYCAGMDIDALGKPLVGVALPSKFFPNNLSYIYQHKKEPRVFFVSTRGSGLPATKTKKLAISPRAFCFKFE